MAQSKLEKATAAVKSMGARIAKSREVAAEQAENVKTVAINLGGAAVGGYARGRMEEADGSWEYMGIEPELGIGAVLVGGSFVNLYGDTNTDVREFGKGLLGGWVHNWSMNRARETKQLQGTANERIFGDEGPQPLIGEAGAGVPVDMAGDVDAELAANLGFAF